MKKITIIANLIPNTDNYAIQGAPCESIANAISAMSAEYTHVTYHGEFRDSVFFVESVTWGKGMKMTEKEIVEAYYQGGCPEAISLESLSR